MVVKIFHTQHVAFAARILEHNLRQLGYDAERVKQIFPVDRCLYIIYSCDYLVLKTARLPQNYIVYNTEVNGSKWFGPDYFRVIKGVKAVWDYSEENTKAYRAYNSNISIVTPGIAPQPTAQKDIDVLFYGWLEGSPRRLNKLIEINNLIPVHIVTNTLGGDMWNLLRRAKVVLNLHYYDNMPLETFRINEALSFGCHVVSETGIRLEIKYDGLVYFSNEVQKTVKAIPKIIQSSNDYDLSALDNMPEIKAAMNKL